MFRKAVVKNSLCLVVQFLCPRKRKDKKTNFTITRCSIQTSYCSSTNAIKTKTCTELEVSGTSSEFSHRSTHFLPPYQDVSLIHVTHFSKKYNILSHIFEKFQNRWHVAYMLFFCCII